MTINLRIKLLACVLIALIALASLAGIFAMDKIGDKLDGIVEDDIPLTTTLAEINIHQLQQEVALEKLLRVAHIDKGAGVVDELATRMQSLSQGVDAQIVAAKKMAAHMMANASNEGAKAEAAKISTALEEIGVEAQRYRLEVDRLIANIVAGDTSGAEALVVQIERDADGLQRRLEALLTEIARFTQSAANDAERTEHNAMAMLIAIFVVGTLVGAAASLLIGRSIARPLERMQRTMADAAHHKDLTLRVDNVSNDEIGKTAASFNGLMSSFQQVLGSVSRSAESVASAAEELSATSQQVASASQKQAESASAMAASVEEMTVSVTVIADHAKAASTRSDETKEISQQGGALIEKLLGEIQHVADAVRSSATIIGALGQRSQNIRNIVSVINEIAEQTNLLALNAAIEAARAGEVGRGFAVVADEVRKLAERSSKATSEIATMITSIQSTTVDAVDQMSAEVREVDNEALLAREVGGAIDQMTRATDAVANAIAEVSVAIREQSIASTDLAQHVESIAQMTEENSAAMQETALAATSLGNLAINLQALVNQFRIA